MEIVFAILILIGAVVAGSTSSTCAKHQGHAWSLPAPRRTAHPAGSDGAACVDRGDVQGES